EPQFAYSWFPCDDDPADKALFEAAITVDTAFVALTNGSPVGVERRGARATYRRRSAYPISTYLIALYVAPYREFTDRYVSERGDTLALRYHVLPGQIQNARIDFADHPAMFDAFERAFGRYPFWEDGYAVAAFAWRGGMEHQTITAVGAELITGRDKIDLLLAHELAHQWWGNAVGPASWNDVWLNEGFATYAEAIYMESREGEAGLRRHMRRRFTTEFGGPLHSPPDGLFTKTTYWKGAWTLHALRGEVGDSLFFRILQDYFKTYRYGSATTEDFKAVCERVADREFGKFFDQFVYRGVGVIELAYDWRAEANDSGGGNETLVLNVQQTQAGYDAYDVRLTVEWRSEDGEPSRRDLRLDRRRQTFRIPIDKAPCAVALDPDEWLPAAISERPKNNR
ncbi:MAG: hypothetical protein GF419_08580, partial [Ignavibacteriales bacterium]|nr:hypothetical protein [Ignavibacteriales bacterium]